MVIVHLLKRTNWTQFSFEPLEFAHVYVTRGDIFGTQWPNLKIPLRHRTRRTHVRTQASDGSLT